MSTRETEILDIDEMDDAPAVPDVDEIHSIVRRQLEEAISHYEENLEPDQVKATDYYWARPFGNEEEGRSQVVSPDVRDATLAQISELIPVFVGPEKVVEFKPHGPEDVEQAEQASDYVNYVFMEDNDGFLILDAAFKDALVRRVGYTKWWWDTFGRLEVHELSGLSQDDLLSLLGDPDIDLQVTGIIQNEAGPSFEVRITRRSNKGKVSVMALPPEEVVWTPGARSLDEAAMVAHVRQNGVPRDELVAMGVPEDLLDQSEGQARRVGSEDLTRARQFDDTDHDFEEREFDDSQKLIAFAEAYTKIDTDGDGIAELRRFRCVGSDWDCTWDNDGLGEIVDEVPIADFCGLREPHAIVGLGNYDLVGNIQLVKSQVERGTLDSLAKAIEPDMEVVTGNVNMQDVVSKERGKIIRVRQPGQMREIVHSFLGPAALEVIGYQDQKRENSTGTSKAAAGLDPDSLQSATKMAVAATVTGLQRRIAYIAKTLAETGMKRMFKGILKLVHKHQPKGRVVRLRNRWVAIDPRAWDAAMDVSVNIALGYGSPDEKRAELERIIQAQAAAIQQGVPFVGNIELRNALDRYVKLAGFVNPDEFFQPWGPEQEQQYQQQKAQQPPPPPDPLMIAAQTDRMKTEAQIQNDQQKLQLQAANDAANAQLERQKATEQGDRESQKLADTAAQQRRKLDLDADVEMAKIAAQADELDMKRRMNEAQIREIEAHIELIHAQTEAARRQPEKPEQDAA